MPSPDASAAPALHLDGRICPSCGYDLRGSDQPRCPECGQAVDLQALQLSSIPWVHRRSLGRFTAYRKTVTFARRRGPLLAREVMRPISLADARSFRRTTVAIAAVPIMLALLLTLTIAFPDLLTHPLNFAAEWLPIAAGLVGIWLFVLTSTGVASYFFHVPDRPPEQQWRGIALSYYVSGPLAWTPIVLIFAAIGIGYFADSDSITSHYSIAFSAAAVIFIAVAVAVLVAEVLETWWLSVALLRRSMQCSFGRAIGCGIGLPLAWAALAVLFLLLLPAACYFLELVIVSLRL